MTVTTAPTLALPLGTSPAGEPVSLNLDANPHTLVVGGTGTGKSNLLRHLVARSSAASAKTTVIDPARRGLGFTDLPDIDLVTNRAAAISVLEGLVTEVARRGEFLVESGAGSWQGLPQEVRDARDVRPIFLVINEYAALVAHESLPKSADREADWFLEAVERNHEAEHIGYLVQKIIRESRFYGVHLVIATQRPDSAIMGASVRENIDNVIMMLHPSRRPGSEHVRMTFGPDSFEAAAATIEDTQDSAPGDAVLSSVTGGVQRVNVPYSK